MKPIALFILFFMAVHNLMQAQNYKPEDAKQLSWLTGKWKMETKTGNIFENWIQTNDSSFQAISYKVKLSGDTVVLENIRLHYRGNQLFYIPTANGQNDNKPISFRFTSLTQNSFVAENPAHDFPQKIHYVLLDKNKLLATVSAIVNGVDKKQVFNFVKE